MDYAIKGGSLRGADSLRWFLLVLPIYFYIVTAWFIRPLSVSNISLAYVAPLTFVTGLLLLNVPRSELLAMLLRARFELALALLMSANGVVWGQLGTEFTYQGKLNDAGQPASGTYNLEISMWDADVAGNQIGVTNSFNNLPISNGLFSVELDFGASSLNGDARWLEIVVDGNTLDPRQPVKGAPYSIQTRGIYVNQDESFIGIGREDSITSAEYFGINAPVNSGYGGMYINTDGAAGLPFYGYSISGSAAMWHYYDAATGDWNLNNSGVRMSIGNDGSASIGNALTAASDGSVAIATDALVAENDGSVAIAVDALTAANDGSVAIAIDALTAALDGSVGIGNDALMVASDGFVGVNRDYSITSAEEFGIYKNTTSFGGMYVETEGGDPFYGYANSGSVEAYHYVDGSTGDWKLYNSGERLVVADDGYVGIGRNTPIDAFSQFDVQTPAGSNQYGGMHVNTTGSQGLPFYGYATGGTTKAFTYYNGGTDTWLLEIGGQERMVVQSNGRVGLSTFAPNYLLHCNGSAGKPGGGSWSNSSDRRLKKNIENLDGSLEKLLRLRGVTYEYIDPKAINELEGKQTGMIAQEVEEVFPDWVDERNDGYKALTFRGFEALAVEALRELRNEKDQEIHKLQNENDELRNRVEALESAVHSLLEKP